MIKATFGDRAMAKRRKIHTPGLDDKPKYT
jgi:hypothetical protein